MIVLTTLCIIQMGIPTGIFSTISQWFIIKLSGSPLFGLYIIPYCISAESSSNIIFWEEGINAGLDFPAHNDHHFVRDSNDNKQWQFRICKGQYNQHLAIINQQGAQQGWWTINPPSFRKTLSSCTCPMKIPIFIMVISVMLLLPPSDICWFITPIIP